MAGKRVGLLVGSRKPERGTSKAIEGKVSMGQDGAVVEIERDSKSSLRFSHSRPTARLKGAY